MLGRVFLIVASTVLLSSAWGSQALAQAPGGPTAQPAAQPPAAAAPADNGQWTMPGQNYASTRYSDLAEINTESVRDLQVTWTFSTGVLRGHEAPPLVVGTTMYVVTP